MKTGLSMCSYAVCSGVPENCGCLYSLDSVASPPVQDVGVNSPALVFPSSSSVAPGSETTIFSRTNGKYGNLRVQGLMMENY